MIATIMSGTLKALDPPALQVLILRHCIILKIWILVSYVNAGLRKSGFSAY